MVNSFRYNCTVHLFIHIYIYICIYLQIPANQIFGEQENQMDEPEAEENQQGMKYIYEFCLTLTLNKKKIIAWICHDQCSGLFNAAFDLTHHVCSTYQGSLLCKAQSQGIIRQYCEPIFPWGVQCIFSVMIKSNVTTVKSYQILWMKINISAVFCLFIFVVDLHSLFTLI